MKVISKFVLNRNNTEFYYVEKKQKANKMKYFVHLSPKEIIEYNDHNFHNIHSIDEKLSVRSFTKSASENLISELYNANSEIGYNYLREVYEKTSNDSNILNPNIKNIKGQLLKGIKIYNESLSSFEEIQIPYEDNYNLLNNEETYVNNKQKVVSINSLLPKEIEDNNILYDLPVKELVRIKKIA